MWSNTQDTAAATYAAFVLLHVLGIGCAYNLVITFGNWLWRRTVTAPRHAGASHRRVAVGITVSSPDVARVQGGAANRF